MGTGTMGSDVVTTIANGDLPVSPAQRVTMANMACSTAAATLSLNRLSHLSLAQHTMASLAQQLFVFDGLLSGAVGSNEILMVLLDPFCEAGGPNDKLDVPLDAIDVL